MLRRFLVLGMAVLFVGACSSDDEVAAAGESTRASASTTTTTSPIVTTTSTPPATEVTTTTSTTAAATTSTALQLSTPESRQQEFGAYVADAGWVRYVDPSGWSISYPPEWRVDEREDFVWLSAPEDGCALGIFSSVTLSFGPPTSGSEEWVRMFVEGEVERGLFREPDYEADLFAVDLDFDDVADPHDVYGYALLYARDPVTGEDLLDGEFRFTWLYGYYDESVRPGTVHLFNTVGNCEDVFEAANEIVTTFTPAAGFPSDVQRSEGVFPQVTRIVIDEAEPGMCIQLPEGNVVFDVNSVPCDMPHDYEIIGTVVMTGSEYPGDDAVYDQAVEVCLPVFETYVGTSYDTSIWWLDAFTPTASSWEAGDRQAICTVFQLDDDNEILRVATSARNDGR